LLCAEGDFEFPRDMGLILCVHDNSGEPRMLHCNTNGQPPLPF
jgi:hypothetical protein